MTWCPIYNPSTRVIRKFWQITLHTTETHVKWLSISRRAILLGVKPSALSGQTSKKQRLCCLASKCTRFCKYCSMFSTNFALTTWVILYLKIYANVSRFVIFFRAKVPTECPLLSMFTSLTTIILLMIHSMFLTAKETCFQQELSCVWQSSWSIPVKLLITPSPYILVTVMYGGRRLNRA